MDNIVPADKLAVKMLKKSYYDILLKTYTTD